MWQYLPHCSKAGIGASITVVVGIGQNYFSPTHISVHGPPHVKQIVISFILERLANTDSILESSLIDKVFFNESQLFTDFFL